MNNVKVVLTKETVMKSNNTTEAVNQKQSNGKMLQKYGAHPQRNTHPTCKSNENQEVITLKSQITIGAPIGIHDTSLEHPL